MEDGWERAYVEACVAYATQSLIEARGRMSAAMAELDEAASADPRDPERIRRAGALIEVRATELSALELVFAWRNST